MTGELRCSRPPMKPLFSRFNIDRLTDILYDITRKNFCMKTMSLLRGV